MKIRCAIYRGGTSKPIFFMEDDLPQKATRRDNIVLEGIRYP
jgi:2-methylaconitate cis-trans-isomerase PrpF